MSLDWSIVECKNWEELKSDEEWPITEAIVFATMVVDLGRITEKNVDEFFTRLVMAESVCGMQLYKWDDEKKYKKSLLTYSAVRRRIGLNTNVSDKSRAYFDKRMAATLRDISSRQLSYQKEKWEHEQRTAA